MRPTHYKETGDAHALCGIMRPPFHSNSWHEVTCQNCRRRRAKLRQCPHKDRPKNISGNELLCQECWEKKHSVESTEDFKHRITAMKREQETGKRYSLIGGPRADESVVRQMQKGFETFNVRQLEYILSICTQRQGRTMRELIRAELINRGYNHLLDNIG